MKTLPSSFKDNKIKQHSVSQVLHLEQSINYLFKDNICIKQKIATKQTYAVLMHGSA